MAEGLNSVWLRGIAASAAGAVLLADGRPGEALAPLREALSIWSELDAPYEAARVRVLVGRACRSLSDQEGATAEWDGAASVFRRFGAAPALAAVEALRQQTASTGRAESTGLTAREIEVLRLVASGRTNREVAQVLDISEKTVARHVSNIFTKIDVPSRAAATAYAFTHRLAP
jgi:DNA-binding NarL/FixJ family response regulator